MKLRFTIPKIVTIKVNASELSKQAHELLATHLNGMDVHQITKGREKLFYEQTDAQIAGGGKPSPCLIHATQRTLSALFAAIERDGVVDTEF